MRGGGGVALWVRIFGLLMGLVALVATGALTVQHLADKSLPGCGVASACASLEAHPAGSLGGLAAAIGAVRRGDLTLLNAVKGTGISIAKVDAVMPMSIMASCYFFALLCAWIFWWLRGGHAHTLRAIRLVARFGAIASLVYLVIIAISEKTCPYCLTAHAANLLWWITIEIGVWASSRRTPTHAAEKTMPKNNNRSTLGSMATGLAVFALGVSVLGVMDADKRQKNREQSAKAEAESRAAMVAQAEQARLAAAQAQTTPASSATSRWTEKGFTGRWRLGPEQAVVRIVLISDYQCQQCKRLEGEALALQAKYPDKVSVSAMHYPLCTDCNKYTNGQNPHPNACWAARAAEAAAMTAGAKATLDGGDAWAASNEAFWKMHRWLFAENGSFTDASFPAGLASLGFDSASFIKVMSSPATLKVVQDDIEAAQTLGLSGTPMVWVNGIELKGWEAPKALENTTEAILKANPPALDARADKPALASEKYVADWRDQNVRAIPTEQTVHAIGPADAPVQIVVYGDYEEPNTAKLDAMLRGMIDQKKPIRYIWRQFPGNKDCNPRVPRVIFANGCTAAQAAEAAATIGGEEAYWKLHTWMLSNQKTLTLAQIQAGAKSLGIDSEALAKAMQTPAVAMAIQEDVSTSAALGVGQIPCIYVNGKWVQRWSRDGDNIMERIVDEAAKTKAK